MLGMASCNRLESHNHIYEDNNHARRRLFKTPRNGIAGKSRHSNEMLKPSLNNYRPLTSPMTKNKIHSTAVLSYLLSAREKNRVSDIHDQIENNAEIHQQLQEIISRRPISTASIKPSDVIKENSCNQMRRFQKKCSRGMDGNYKTFDKKHRSRLNTSTKFDSVLQKIEDFERRTKRITSNNLKTKSVFSLPHGKDKPAIVHGMYAKQHKHHQHQHETVPMSQKTLRRIGKYRHPPNLPRVWEETTFDEVNQIEPSEQFTNFNSFPGFTNRSSHYPETLCWSRYYADNLISPENWYFGTKRHIMNTPIRIRSPWDETPSSMMHRNRRFVEPNFSKAFMFEFINSNQNSEIGSDMGHAKSNDTTLNRDKISASKQECERDDSTIIEMSPETKRKPLRRTSKALAHIPRPSGRTRHKQTGLKRTLLGLLGLCLIIIAVICIAYHLI